eukprot:scaffold54580_cov61-Phaeocystis_antarctica.AAC.1
MATACDHSPQQVRVAEAFTDVKGGGGVTGNAKKEIMSKDKNERGDGERSTNRPQPAQAASSPSTYMECGDRGRVRGYGFIYFRLAEWQAT